MKSIVSFLIFTCAATTASAGLFDSLATSDWPTRNVDSKYKLEVYGYNARVYEFTPKANKNITCIVVYSGGDQKGIQMRCIPKSK